MRKNSVFIVAEVGQAHEGSIGILHSYIDAAAACHVDAVKFQTHIASAESSPLEPFRVPFSYEDKTRQDYWRRMEFSLEQWIEIKQHCDEVGVEFMSSPFSIASIELLEKVGMKRYKVASGEINNFLMLDRIAQTKKPVILSSGLSNYDDLDQAVERIHRVHNDVSVLQCTSEYPVPFSKVGLNVLSEFKQRYGCKVGLSDHSGTIAPSLAAVSLGADIIEAHIVFDKGMFGPDSKASLTPKEFTQMVTHIRAIEEMLAHPVDKQASPDSDMRAMFGKSLSVNRDMAAGESLSIDCLESKKPAGQGVSPKYYEALIGKTLTRDVAQYDFIKEGDYE